MKKLSVLTVVILGVAGLAASQQPPAKEQKPDPAVCPLHEEHTKAKKAATAAHEHDFAAMNKRGDDARGMGFSQTETTHHFLLQKSGGAIQVEVNNAKDDANRDAIRKHLRNIADSFTKGDFSIPNFVHGEDPAGVKELRTLEKAVQYRFEELPQGGRVVLVAKSAEALQAVHSFLRYQIYEHRTGDSLEPPK